DCQKIIKKSIVERLKAKHRTNYLNETGPVINIRFSILKDVATLMIDTSGDGLHKRGYRRNSNDAPIKETLAAAMCHFTRLYPDTQLYDPFCGSGTILIEAAMQAANIAPGLHRRFAAETYPFLSKGAWKMEREAARAAVNKDIDFRAFGSDIDPAAVELTLQNAKLAGVEELVSAKVADIADFKMPEGRATVITNPPYGERLGDEAAAIEIYRAMGRVFSPEAGKRYGIITPQEDFSDYFGRAADKTRKLYNGMIKCRYNMYFR
ncbi:MAG: N-6 DNA methylase, partial [Clostridia bacterium]|nr:N-6 DNA methylase [Clostridia bacterium]